ncbi:MAG: M15 family metallopeptidase [Burkholderiales bacterium]|nr:M15 family metallopeptidase [Bacteroidia bacterium]
MPVKFKTEIYFLAILICFNGCTSSNEHIAVKVKNTKPLTLHKETPTQHDTSSLERLFLEKGLLNINSLDSTIRVVLHYATTQNFLNKPLYNGLNDCYLPCEVGIKLSNAQYFLHEQFPNYHLIVFDAVRPLHIQKQMWDELDMPSKEKINYLAHPDDISLHNYGAAVDVGIIGSNDVLLEMGTPFDFFGELSEPKKEQEFLLNGKLTKEALTNRLLLRSVMVKAGFMTITTEWWHFNSSTKIIAAEKYELIE